MALSSTRDSVPPSGAEHPFQWPALRELVHRGSHALRAGGTAESLLIDRYAESAAAGDLLSRQLLNQSGVGAYLYGMVGSMAVQVADLVHAAATGDEAAFTELVSRHHRDLLRVAYVICRESALAEDSAQAAWAIAWRRMGDVKDPTQIRGWLVAVAANEARRTMRSRRPRVHEISVGDIELEGVPDLRSDPLADSIASSDLRRVLASLDPTDRALIALRYVAELSSDEIGRALGMSPSGARGRLSRLLVRLRGELDD